MHFTTKIILIIIILTCSSWGFFAHKKINRLAVFTLPVEMIPFYKKNIRYIEEAAVNPDRRRYAVKDEAPRHFIDLDDYNDSSQLPRYWKQAVEKYGVDYLEERGVVPWTIERVYLQLKDAFVTRNPEKILKLSADLGYYVADAHVPLHTTKNYDGQLTNQVGIHGLWESRLPELFFDEYDFYTGKAKYIKNVQLEAWKIVQHTNQLLDSVLRIEKQLSEHYGEKKFSFESKGKQTVKVFSIEFSKAYHEKLHHMVERQMCASVLMVGSMWYSAWVDAGQPDLKSLLNYKPSAEELKQREEEYKKWREAQKDSTRRHRNED